MHKRMTELVDYPFKSRICENDKKCIYFMALLLGFAGKTQDHVCRFLGD